MRTSLAVPRLELPAARLVSERIVGDQKKIWCILTHNALRVASFDACGVCHHFELIA
jgi:hypothetical protein